jgi:hypothetical protein
MAAGGAVVSRLFSRRSFHKVKPGETGYKSPTATQYRILRGKRAGEVVSLAEHHKLVYGAHPTKLSALLKAGKRRYKTTASEAQAQAQIKTRARLSRVGKWLHPNEVKGRHPFLNTAGVEQSAKFKGRDLAVMQTYREDVHGRYDREDTLIVPGALQTGDGSELAKYKRMKIYDADGNRVFPETDIKKLQAWWNRKTVRARNRFEADLFQSGELEAAA